MQNHAMEITKKTDYNVYFAGYTENDPRPAILNNPDIYIYPISCKLINKLKKLPRFLYLLYAFLRIIIQILQLTWMMIKMYPLEFIILQNPPAVPIISTLCALGRLTGTKVIIDMHNYGFTILNLNVKNRIIIWCAKKYEMWFAKLANNYLCVSNEMKKDLLENYGLSATVVYDKANTEVFKPLSALEKSAFREKLETEILRE